MQTSSGQGCLGLLRYNQAAVAYYQLLSLSICCAATLAGAANLTDMLTEPGGEGNSAQLGGEAGASPLFKWTSDGSMMEELMKAYK